MKKPSWIDVKRQLSDKERKELVELIKKLYQADKRNQSFLHTYFALSKNYLKPYKEKIERFVLPDILRGEDYAVAKAKKAISDYKKALGKPQDIAELEIFYCESCGYFLESISLDDEYYCLELERMFERAINSTLLLSKKRQKKLFARLDRVFYHSENWGWDVRGGLETIIAENEKVYQFFSL